MALGIDHCKALLVRVGDLAVKVIKLVKDRKFGEFLAFIKILADLKGIVAELKQALPELKDLDGAEASELASEAYALVKRVVEAVVA